MCLLMAYHLSCRDICKLSDDKAPITYMHRKISNMNRTKLQNLNRRRLVLQLSLPNPLKPGV